MSRGEVGIRTWLTVNQLEFEYQKVLKGCINKRTKQHLIFDYYLPTLNIAIEFDGSQHFTPHNSFHNTNSEFFQQVSRDRQKDRYCKANGIRLIRIPFYDASRMYRILSREILTQSTSEPYNDEAKEVHIPFQENQAVF